MLLYNKQSIFFSIYSTISKSYLDPLMDRNWELLVTELVQHFSFLGAPLFFEQSIFINLVDCSLNFPLTHRQFVVSYLRLIQRVRKDKEILVSAKSSAIGTHLEKQASQTLCHLIAVWGSITELRQSCAISAYTKQYLPLTMLSDLRMQLSNCLVSSLTSICYTECYSLYSVIKQRIYLLHLMLRGPVVLR